MSTIRHGRRKYKRGQYTKWTPRKTEPRAYKKGVSLQQERKFKDTALTDAVVAIGGAITNSVNLVAQGTGEDERIGRKIIIRSLAARFEISLPSLDAQATFNSGGDIVRIIAFVDHQANGANTAVLDILETATYDSYRNLANRYRFQILMDKFIILNRNASMNDAVGTGSFPLVLRYHSCYKQLAIPVEFDSTAGVITEVQSNNIAFLYISAKGKAGITVQCTRIRYDG